MDLVKFADPLHDAIYVDVQHKIVRSDDDLLDKLQRDRLLQMRQKVVPAQVQTGKGGHEIGFVVI